MNKPFLENMSKEERQAFSYLEDLIFKSKMECLAAIPRTQIYDDSEIKTKVQSIETKFSNYKINQKTIITILNDYQLLVKDYYKTSKILTFLKKQLFGTSNLMCLMMIGIQSGKPLNEVFSDEFIDKWNENQKLGEEINKLCDEYDTFFSKMARNTKNLPDIYELIINK